MVTIHARWAAAAVALTLATLGSLCTESSAATLASVIPGLHAKNHRARRGSDSSIQVFHGNIAESVRSVGGEALVDDDDTDLLISVFEIGKVTVAEGDTVAVEAAVASLAYAFLEGDWTVMQSITQGSVTMNVALHMPDGNVQAGLPGSLTIKRLQAETQTGEDDDDGMAQAMTYLTEGVSGGKWIFASLASNTYTIKVTFTFETSATLMHDAHLEEFAASNNQSDAAKQETDLQKLRLKTFQWWGDDDDAENVNRQQLRPGLDQIVAPVGNWRGSVGSITAESYVVVVTKLDASAHEVSACDRVDNDVPEYYDYCNDDPDARFQPDDAEDEKWRIENKASGCPAHGWGSGSGSGSGSTSGSGSGSTSGSGSGPIDGACTFPFRFEGEDVFTCQDTGEWAWCYFTTAGDEGDDSQWGYCDDSCPLWVPNEKYFNDHHGFTCAMIVTAGNCDNGATDVNRPSQTPNELCCGCGGGDRSPQNKDAFENKTTAWEAFVDGVTKATKEPVQVGEGLGKPKRNRRNSIGALDGSKTKLCYSAETTQITCNSLKVSHLERPVPENAPRPEGGFEKIAGSDGKDIFHTVESIQSRFDNDNDYENDYYEFETDDDDHDNGVFTTGEFKASYTGVMEVGSVATEAGQTMLVEVAVDSLAQTFVNARGQHESLAASSTSTLTMKVVMYPKGSDPGTEDDLVEAFPGPVVLNSVKHTLVSERHPHDYADSFGLEFETASTGAFYFTGQAAGEYNIDVIFTLETDFKGGDAGDDDGSPEGCLWSPNHVGGEKSPWKHNPAAYADPKLGTEEAMWAPVLAENEDFACEKPTSSTLTVGSHSVVVTTFDGNADTCTALATSVWSGRRERRGTSGNAEVCHSAGAEVIFKTASVSDGAGWGPSKAAQAKGAWDRTRPRGEIGHGTMVGDLDYGTVAVAGDEQMLVEVTVESMAQILGYMNDDFQSYEHDDSEYLPGVKALFKGDAKLSMDVVAFGQGGEHQALPGALVVNRLMVQADRNADWEGTYYATEAHVAVTSSNKGIFYFPKLDAGDYAIRIRFTLQTTTEMNGEAQVWIGDHVVTVTTFADDHQVAADEAKAAEEKAAADQAAVVSFALAVESEEGAKSVEVPAGTQVSEGEQLTFSAGGDQEETVTVLSVTDKSSRIRRAGGLTIAFDPALQFTHPVGTKVTVSATALQASSNSGGSSKSDTNSKTGKGDRKAAVAFGIINFFLLIGVICLVREMKKRRSTVAVAPAPASAPASVAKPTPAVAKPTPATESIAAMLSDAACDTGTPV